MYHQMNINLSAMHCLIPLYPWSLTFIDLFLADKTPITDKNNIINSILDEKMNTKKKSEGFVGVHIGAGQHSEVSNSSSNRS